MVFCLIVCVCCVWVCVCCCGFPMHGVLWCGLRCAFGFGLVDFAVVDWSLIVGCGFVGC